jgi:hypothetical protein
MPRSARTVAFLLLAGGVAGCAALAKPTPTPAAKLDPQVLKAPAPPNEKYYGLIFGAQKVAYLRPDLTHTWATVVKATWEPGCDQPALDVQSISWMPANFQIQPFNFTIQPPVNLPLHDTLAWTQRTGQKVAMWGPYELHPRVYRRFIVQKEFLDSGAVGYQTIDTVGEAARTGLGCDCIHAISDLDPKFDRARYPLIFYGQPAARRLVHEAARREVFIDPWTEHDWLVSALGLDQYPIERKPQPYKGVRRPIDPDRPARVPLVRRRAGE